MSHGKPPAECRPSVPSWRRAGSAAAAPTERRQRERDSRRFSFDFRSNDLGLRLHGLEQLARPRGLLELDGVFHDVRAVGLMDDATQTPLLQELVEDAFDSDAGLFGTIGAQPQ